MDEEGETDWASMHFGSEEEVFFSSLVRVKIYDLEKLF